MSRVIEALDRKRKCTNYRDGLSCWLIGGWDWLVHLLLCTAPLRPAVCVWSLLEYAERLDASTEEGFIIHHWALGGEPSQPGGVGLMFRASVHPACSAEYGGRLTFGAELPLP